MPTPDIRELERPPCPKCGTEMRLSLIEPELPDHDRRVFECPACSHEETMVVKYK